MARWACRAESGPSRVCSSRKSFRAASPFQPSGSAAVKVRDHAIAQGLMMRATDDTMILSPPLIWTRETIDIAADRIGRALDLAARDLGRA